MATSQPQEGYDLITINEVFPEFEMVFELRFSKLKACFDICSTKSFTMPILLSIGIAYMLALGSGRMCAAIGIPRVTGYL